ncbi:hypothetical protein DICPUDRAFT_98285 [Dictyostelium purpureum]|uniref:L-serine ammonia-lyase n=1 Tax=Dictyostelium purpureum TaxID=5786 RepID=F0ZP75_DICPU|nr:uncharacterized protein DICPUDRAFT_98285 [Dictyostelium purpureum]EGC34255.1 hypothetical protein DICPUDRAFT_98285 [Dictyostelium purpureum]|eukprot:XP_003289224.1 hypothetical protein DICPUDRAFT_98285 [Dictyostelium purpureum]
MGLSVMSPNTSCDSIEIKSYTQLHINSPFLESLPLSKLYTSENAKVWMKIDAVQPSGSFKIRGIGLLCNKVVNEKNVKHLICSSGGNAGKSVAYAGRKLGIKTTIVLPTTIPEETVEKIRDEGANVIVHGNIWDDADSLAREIALKEGLDGYIHPFDNPTLWEGHTTIIDEIYQDVSRGISPKPDVILCSVGGGGLLIGILKGLEKYNWSDIPIITAETYGSHSFWKSHKENKLTKLEISEVTSTIKTLATRSVCSEAFEMSRRFKIIPILVSDREAVEACLKYVDQERILVEPACGASLAILYKKPTELLNLNPKNILTIVCGGNGTSISSLNKSLQTLPIL